MDEKHFVVALYSFIPFGPARFELLLKYFGSAQNAWKSSSSELIKIGLRSETVSKFISHRNSFNFDTYFKNLEKKSINFVTKFDTNYPKNLKGMKGSPVVLYFKGRLTTDDENAIAIVGARKMTSYGRAVTEKFATELANYKVTIISGLALGVDTVAHKAAIATGGRTIAVVGSGLDLVYPANNEYLIREMVEKECGVVISEYPLGYPALRNNFVNRNRIISGLSKGVVVIEGRAKSGTILTAHHAAEQGRTVFAIPGQITSPMSEAPFYLIENGAKMAIRVKDIIDELDLQLTVDKHIVEKLMPSDDLEIKILDVIKNEEIQIDEIARILKMKISDVSSKLTLMELKGLVKSVGDGVYCLRN